MIEKLKANWEMVLFLTIVIGGMGTIFFIIYMLGGLK